MTVLQKEGLHVGVYVCVYACGVTINNCPSFFYRALKIINIMGKKGKQECPQKVLIGCIIVGVLARWNRRVACWRPVVLRWAVAVAVVVLILFEERLLDVPHADLAADREFQVFFGDGVPV